MLSNDRLDELFEHVETQLEGSSEIERQLQSAEKEIAALKRELESSKGNERLLQELQSADELAARFFFVYL